MFSFMSQKRDMSSFILWLRIVIQMEAETAEEAKCSSSRFNTHCFNLLYSKIGNHFSSKLASIPFLNEGNNLAKFEVHSFSHFSIAEAQIKHFDFFFMMENMPFSLSRCMVLFSDTSHRSLDSYDFSGV